MPFPREIILWLGMNDILKLFKETCPSDVSLIGSHLKRYTIMIFFEFKYVAFRVASPSSKKEFSFLSAVQGGLSAGYGNPILIARTN